MHILYITFSFPPRNEIAQVRLWNIAKGLSQAGNTVTVVTVKKYDVSKIENENYWKSEFSKRGIKLFEVPFAPKSLLPGYFLDSKDENFIQKIKAKLIRFIHRQLKEEPNHPWKKHVLKKLNKVDSKGFDLILASGGPFVNFEIAYDYGSRNSIPYVLDYRDPWSMNPRKEIRSLRIRRREKKILRHSAGVISVTEGMNTLLQEWFDKERKKKYFTVTNGYESERIGNTEKEINDSFSIVYTGSFYPPMGSIEPVFKALARIKNYTVNDWNFHYYGKHGKHIEEMSIKYNLNDKIVDHGLVPKEKALQAAKSADIFTVISSVYPETTTENKIMVTGKIFDALGAGTPILLIAPPGSDPEKIMGNRGVRFSGDQIEEMAEYLRSVIENGIERNTPAYEYEWSRLADRYNDIVQNLVKEYQRENNH